MYEYRRLTPQQRAELVQQRLSLGFPPHSPPHPVRDQPFYLLTAACYEHRHHMRAQSRRQQVLEALYELFTMNGMGIRAWVVLPNHYHLLAHVPDFDVLGSIFRRVHGPTSRKWNLEDATPGRKVWYRFTDRGMVHDAVTSGELFEGASGMTFEREQNNGTSKHSAQDSERFHCRNLPTVGDSGQFSGQKHTSCERCTAVTVQLCNLCERA